MGDGAFYREIRHEPKATPAAVGGVALGSLLAFGLAWLVAGGLSRSAPVAPYVFAVLASSALWVALLNRSGLLVTISRERIRAASLIEGKGGKRQSALFDVRWDEARVIEEVTEFAAAERGAAPARSYLRVGDHVLRDAQFGCVGRTGVYADLVAAVRAAVGDRLVARELRGRAP